MMYVGASFEPATGTDFHNEFIAYNMASLNSNSFAGNFYRIKVKFNGGTEAWPVDAIFA